MLVPLGVLPCACMWGCLCVCQVSMHTWWQAQCSHPRGRYLAVSIAQQPVAQAIWFPAAAQGQDWPCPWLSISQAASPRSPATDPFPRPRPCTICLLTPSGRGPVALCSLLGGLGQPGWAPTSCRVVHGARGTVRGKSWARRSPKAEVSLLGTGTAWPPSCGRVHGGLRVHPCPQLPQLA